MACVVCLRALVPAPCEPVHPCRLDRGVPPPDIVNKEAQTLRKRAPRDKGAPGRAKSSPGATQIDAGNEKKLFCRKCCKYYACHTELRFGSKIDAGRLLGSLGRPHRSTLALERARSAQSSGRRRCARARAGQVERPKSLRGLERRGRPSRVPAVPRR